MTEAVKQDRRRPRLVLTRKLPEPVERRAAEIFECVFNRDDRALTRDDLASLVQDANAVLCSPTELVDAALIDAFPRSIKVVATFSAGVDHIDLAAARSRGIAVVNTPDVLTDATADVAMLLMLGAARGAWMAQMALREGRWRRWAPTEFLGKDLADASLGLVGFGRIARAVARRALGFGMRVQCWNRTIVDPPPGLELVVQIADLDDLVRSSDVLSLHIPGTPETANLMDERRLALMPSGGILVNTARGSLVDDDALINALQTGHLFAAGLDVFKNEPALDHRYLSQSNVYLLPHIGSATERARIAMGMSALAQLERHFQNARE